MGQQKLARRLKESTVRTVLRRLEDKGYVKHAVDGRTYVYQAAHPRAKVAANAVQRIVDLFCNGSVEEILVGMVDSAMLDQKQLRTLADKVAQAKASCGPCRESSQAARHALGDGRRLDSQPVQNAAITAARKTK